MKQILIIGLILLSGSLSAQETVMERYPSSLREHPNRGPNRRHYIHPVAGFSAFALQESTPAFKPLPPQSAGLFAGIRYKLKLSSPLAACFDLSAEAERFGFSNPAEQETGSSATRLSKTLISKGISGSICLRIRFGQRGDYLGNFVDLGAQTRLRILNTLKIREVIPASGSMPESHRTVLVPAPEYGGFYPAAIIRLGFNRVILFAEYDLSGPTGWNTQSPYPKLEIGAEVSLKGY